MNNSVKFRNSVKGYNKQDVIEYIAELSAEHDEARAQYETELARAHREAETEKEAAKISEAKAEELATELYAALERERELKRSVSGLAARIAKYEKEKAARKATVKQKVKKTLFKKQKEAKSLPCKNKPCRLILGGTAVCALFISFCLYIVVAGA